jgi:hypothetical protein
MGLEPTTLGTTNRCSNQLSYIYRFVRRTPSEEFAKIENSGRFANSFFDYVVRLESWRVEMLKFRKP